MQERVPAIVLGRNFTGLGALRSLAMAGIPAYVACAADDLVTRSRWYRPFPGRVAWDGEIRADTYEVLRSLPFERAVLIPARDDLALWVADIPQSELSERFLVSSSSRETLEILQDKSRFGEFMSRAGIPHPRTFTIGNRADIDAIPFDELDQVFIKPADSHQFRQALKLKGIWARSRNEFEAIWSRLDLQGFRVVAQEYVPGSNADHYLVDGFRDRNGRITGLFARHKFRMHPPDFGNASYCESIPLAQVGPCVEHVTELVSRLNYRGIFSAEFKRDSRDGAFRMLEVNTRAWWYVEFAARCGMNACQMAYQDALAQPVVVAPKQYPVGEGCVNLLGDFKSMCAGRAGGRFSWPEAIAQWARAHYHVFRWDDPVPGLSETWRILRRRLAALVAPSR